MKGLRLSHQPDEVDITKLLCQLWNSKRVIATITSLVLVLAVAYLSLVKPTYQSQSIAVAPPAAALQRYNLVAYLAHTESPTHNEASDKKEKEVLVASLIQPIDTEDVYNAFQQSLKSQALLQTFFTQHYLPYFQPNATALEKEQLFERFTKQLHIKTPKPDSNEFESVVTLTLNDAELTAKWVNDYVAMALEVSRTQLLNNLNVQRNEHIRAIESRIAVLRDQAVIDNINRISRIRDAMNIAKSIDLAHPSSSGNLITSYSGETMYLRGYQALAAELELHENRQDFDPYIEDLPLLQQQLDMIQRSVMPGSEFVTAQVDLSAITPINPIAPKKALILVIAAVLGFMLACMWVLLRDLIRSERH